jgi:transcriptional regulator with XRE-family HTH domain
LRRNEVPNERGVCLYVLRSLRGWTQVELADALGTAASVISEYENGRRRTSERTVHRAAEALGIPQERVYVLLSFLRELQGLMGSTPPPRSSRIEIIIEEFYMGVEAFAREVAEVILATVGEPSRPPEPADVLWSRLESLEKENRWFLVDIAESYQTRELCQRLCEESLAAAADDSEDSALELADLALHVAERVGGGDFWRWRVQGYAWAHVGHARRRYGDLDGAREAFARFRQLWEQGAPADPSGLLDEARVLGLEAGEACPMARTPTSGKGT